MMLRRTCQALASRLLRVRLDPAGASSAAFASRPGAKRSKKGEMKAEAQREERDNPGYLEELADTQQLMTFAESSSPVGSSFRARLRAENRIAVRRRVAAAKAAKLRPPEVNLLTWAAKRQLVELAAAEPDLWTPRALAEVFPVSAAQAGRLLKSARGGSLRLRDPAAIYRHDRAVLERLRQLEGARKEEGGRPKLEDVQPGFEWLVRSDKWQLLPHAAGNPVLPLPQKQLIEDGLEKAARRPVGPFEALVQAQEDARPPPTRLQAFMELCERQKVQLQATMRSFTAEETKEKYREAGLLSKPSEEAERPSSAPKQHLTMFAAAADARELPTSEEVVPERAEEEDGRTSFGELVERLESDPEGLPRSNSKLEKVRPPLSYRSRVRMDRLQIFRYSFALATDEKVE